MRSAIWTPLAMALELLLSYCLLKRICEGNVFFFTSLKTASPSFLRLEVFPIPASLGQRLFFNCCTTQDAKRAEDRP